MTIVLRLPSSAATHQTHLRMHRFCTDAPISVHGGSQCAFVLVLKLQLFLYSPEAITKHLGVDVKVILTPPCIICIESC
jgi:hypothetical protein